MTMASLWAAPSFYKEDRAETDTDTPTFSAEISISAARFWLTGLTRGTTVYFRILACDARLPGGRTTWTAWLSVQVA